MLCACVRNPKPEAAVKNASAASPGAEAARSAPDTGAAAGAATGAALGASTLTPAPPRPQPLPLKTGSGLQGLLTLGRNSSVLPEDSMIGLLSGAGDLTGDEAGAGAAAAEFLAGLVKGKVEAELLSASRSSAFVDSLERNLALGSVPTSFRLGKPKKLSDGELAFNVRLFKAEGSAEGEIYLEPKDKRWKVSDFQISLSQLSEKRKKDKETFIPNSYRWLLGE
jgi:hypothetical protein